MGAGSRATLLSGIVPGFGQTPAAFFVLAVGLVISYSAWRFAEQWVGGDAAGKFQNRVTQAVETVEQRFQDNINILLGLKGLFAASHQVDRDEFQRYLAVLDIERRFPGLRLIAYAAHVPHTRRTAFVERVRRDRSASPLGYPDFTIKPPGEREDYLVVTYLEPFLGNQRSFGFDIYSEPGRRVDLDAVRDSGHPTASGPVRIVTDPQKPINFLLRVPIYRRDMPVKTVAQRRAAFQGVVTAIIRVDELMQSLLGKQLGTEFDLVVHDFGASGVSEPNASIEGSQLFDSRKQEGAETAVPGPSRSAIVEIAGRRWRMTFFSPTQVGYGVEHALPLTVFLGGLVTSFLLFWLIWALSASRSRALKIAEQATAVRTAEGLREQLVFIQQLIEAVPQPIFFKDAGGRYLGVNKAWEGFFGIPREQFIGKSVFELYPNNPELARKHHAKDLELFDDPGSQSYEAAIVAADGRVHHTIYNKATFNKLDGSVAGLIGTINDVTGLKEAEAALRLSEGRFRDLTELSSDWYWEQDANFRFTQMSSKVYEFSMDAEEHIGRTRWEMPLQGVSPEQWDAHKSLLAAHEPFQDFVYQRRDTNGNLRIISVSGRPIFGEQGRFKGYRGTGRDITEKKQVEEKIQHMAHHDALTQLPNRALLYDRIGQAIAQAQRNQESLALLFIDLDRFKTVNDSLGHPVGDRLLKTVGERLMTCTRGSDTVARIGGDEFVVLLGYLEEPEDARHVAQKVLDALSEPVMIDMHELKVTPSIGICAYPHDGEDVETLMRNADTAMYHAKQMGRNNYQFFTQAMNDAAQERLLLENDLRHALERGEFTLHYQPQLDLNTGRIVGFEALVRWRHPHRGMVAPSQFILAAEETGLIGPLGEWVLRQACSQARAWHEAGHPQLQVAVNCSAQQFQREGFDETVRHILRDAGVPAGRLDLEITESIIIQRSEEVIARFQALDDMGVHISIDDFGTGYSSLSYLKRLAIHQLKIDQSFVRDISSDPDDAAIVSAIIAIAHSL
ncbi:MAG TPA: EAL domain-containing protein, partial [Burkholderiales bacterium]|nr:EAL domain-containing protein [Burkholderiales bacterium]